MPDLLSGNSFQRFDTIPSAIVSDGIVPIPLWGVTQMTLTETYQFPPIGTTGAKSIVATHDDNVTIKGSLVGASRFLWKVALETLAESSKRGGTKLLGFGPRLNGVILITAMTIRTEMQIKTLTFDVNATKRHSIDVTLSMDYMPQPKSTVGKLVDMASPLIGVLADFGGN